MAYKGEGGGARAPQDPPSLATTLDSIAASPSFAILFFFLQADFNDTRFQGKARCSDKTVEQIHYG